MVVKFLSSSSTFNGVSYNTTKTEKDLGELMKVANFGYLQNAPNLKPEEYKNYLKAYSEMNTSVQEKQFHVAISCKGREYDKDQLTRIAEAYMQEMGYANNPYLIIYHKDTENNHVHVVSSRINPNGKKVDDSFEYRRSMAAIQQILKTDIGIETERLANKFFDYSISTEAQFRLLFERAGFRVAINDQAIVLRKYDNIQKEIPLSVINNQIQKSKDNETRLRQLRAIINKYKLSADSRVQVVYEPSKLKDISKPIGYTSELVELLRSKVGLDIAFHGKNGREPYGYTIIDHSHGAVYKGSDVMQLHSFIDNSLFQARADLPTQQNIKVDSFKEQEAVRQLFDSNFTETSLVSLTKGDQAIISSRLKSSIYEYNTVAEGLKTHRLQAYHLNSAVYVHDHKSGFFINANRLLNDIDHLKLERQIGLTRPQKEKEIVINRDNSRAYSIRGTLKSYGAAVYQFEKTGTPSFFIEIQKKDGTSKTIWGADLERALSVSSFQVGDFVQLNYKGFKDVQVQVAVKDDHGNVTHYEDKVVKRNDWELSAPDDRNTSNSSKEHQPSLKASYLESEEGALLEAVQGFELSIADDIDDEQINGRNRRRVRKSRINTR